MSQILRMFLHSCVALSVLTVLSVAETCIKDDSCSCHTSTRKISLKSLSSTTNDPSFSVRHDANTVYFYNPCKEFTKQATTAGSQAVTADVIQEQASVYYALGQDNTATFSGDPDQGTLTLTYSHVDSQTRFSIFSLKCAPGKNELQFINEDPQLSYHFILNTDVVCTTQSGGLSTGSILVILFFVFLVVYLIAGILFLKFVRRAEGLEMVPNVEFWKALPSLIRDGCCFTFRGCKAESTYEKI